MNGKALLLGVLMMTIPILTTGSPLSAQGNSSFKGGCVVREWEADATPSYRVTNPAECQRLDRQLDGGDGPNRGRVRKDFRRPKNKRAPWDGAGIAPGLRSGQDTQVNPEPILASL
jgi:hypothetical protein